MSRRISEDDLEQSALDWLRGLGYAYAHGPSLEPDGHAQERETFGEVVLAGRLQAAIARLNPGLPAEAVEQACRRVLRPEAPGLLANNRAFHRMLTDGVPVQYRREGRVVDDLARLVDFEDPVQNDWLAVNQMTVVEHRENRRPDVVVFVNGIPLAVIELKNPGDEKADIKRAINQLQTYKSKISSLFVYNALLVASDGVNARVGTLTADHDRFMAWKTIEGPGDSKPYRPISALEVLMRGVFEPGRLLELIRHFIVFEETPEGIQKKLAAYHQYHAVKTAVEATVSASGRVGSRKAGVVWHTQGSGKSLTMVFYAGQLILAPAMENPTLVILTDRNDLDGQLFGTFWACRELLRQDPVQATSGEGLSALLATGQKRVIFTTIQKFAPGPALSARRNLIVIADEAHRSQYGLAAKARTRDDQLIVSYGFAKYVRDALPNATFIGFTGTPIELNDRSTRQVFGDYISVYDIKRAVDDGATVPILYESRLVRLNLKDEAEVQIDDSFEAVTEGEEEEAKEGLKSQWAQLEALVGEPKRLAKIAADIVEHFEARQTAADGKAMIVCMSRRICVELYRALIALRPEWHSDDDDHGVLKVVMTGSASDPADWQPHLRSKAGREALATRFKKVTDPFKLVIVRDMWLTGFDVPCLHTMYLDKPMHGHGLMQAIARVNRVFGDKRGGLVVDYLGLAENLRRALVDYTASGGEGQTHEGLEQAVDLMREKYHICRGMLFGVDWGDWLSLEGKDKFAAMCAAADHLLERDRERGKARWLKAVAELSAAYALVVTHPAAIEIREDVAFFQAVRVYLAKLEDDASTGATPAQAGDRLGLAVRQIVSNALAPGEVVDLFAVAGLKKPDLSVLDDEFLAELQKLPTKNLAAEILRKLLNDQITARQRTHLVQARSFRAMLEDAIRRYQNRAIESMQVIQELLELAAQIRADRARGGELELTEAEVAFYDALETNDSAVKVLGDPVLKDIARELVKSVRANASIDWTLREQAQAKMRAAVKRILRKYGYPPDRQERATLTVLEQAKLLAVDWAEAVA